LWGAHSVVPATRDELDQWLIVQGEFFSVVGSVR